MSLFLRLVFAAALSLPVWSQPAYFGEFTPAAPSSVSLKPGSPDWYKDEIFYHVWLHSFADSDGDGTGDLRGVASKLDYLQDLGVTSLWLSPFWKSPSTHGYDVVDYTLVDARYGTNDDLRALLAAAHAKGMKVIFDFVPNHVSAQNPWFTDSRDDKNGRRNWFLWKPRVPASGWNDFGGRPAWHAAGGQYYYSIFWDQMPDLNYREPQVRTAMADVVATWLNFGFDGLRVDAVKYLFEDDATGANADRPETLEFFRRLRHEVLDAYSRLGYPKFMVAENWTDDYESLNAYLSSDGSHNDGLHATLDFPFGYAVTNILNGTGTVEGDLGREYENLIRAVQNEGAWTLTFLSNHDNYQSRPATLYGSAKMRVAMALQMTGWGTPVLYYGNEAEMRGVNGNDANMRAPFPWKAVSALRDDPGSVWHWQASLDALRRGHPALRRGDWTFLSPRPDFAAAYLRTSGTDKVLVVLNLTEEPLDAFEVPLPAPARTLFLLTGEASPASLSGGSLKVGGLPPFGVSLYQLDR